MRFLLNWLLNHLMFAGTMFFAAGAIADAGASDTPPVESPTESDTGTEGGTEPPPESAPPPEVKADAKADVKVDGRQLPAKVRELMDGLKASDPKAHGWLKDILFADRAFRQEFPGGLPEAKKLKETVDSFTKEFPDGIEGVKAEQAEWRGIDEAWNAADPKVIDVWMDANPQAFSKLMPTAINKFAAADPDGYQRYQSSVILATLQQSGVLGNLRFLDRALKMGDKETGAALLQEIHEWIGKIDETAKSKPKAAERDPDFDQREHDLTQREFKIWADGTAAEVNSFKTNSIKNELAQYIKGQNLDDETFAAIELQALKYLDPLLTGDPQFAKLFNQYAENRDRDGMVRLMKSKLQELLPSKPGKPGPVEKAYKLFFRGATPAQKPKPVAAKPGAPAESATKGWEKVGKAPAPQDIDMKASPFEMRFKQGAVLKNGKKVFWGANAPA